MNKNDLRYIKTEELIIQAFLSCARDYDFEDIHIKDICTRARISRNAFYGHYENRDQLLEKVCELVREKILGELTPEIIFAIASGNSIEDGSAWVIRTIRQNADSLRIIAKCSDRHFRELIHSVFIETTLKYIFDNTERIRDDIYLKMSEEYITGAMISTARFILRENNEIDEKELTRFLYEMSHHSVEYFYDRIDRSKKANRRVK